MLKSEKFEKQSFLDLVKDIKFIDLEKALQTTNPIIFDTNFLFVPFEFKIDLIGEVKRLVGSSYNFYIYQGTIDELLNIEKKGDKNKKFLPLISKMLHVYNFKIIKSNQKYVDNQIIVNFNPKLIIATNDKELRQKLIKEKFKIILMRQKSYLLLV